MSSCKRKQVRKDDTSGKRSRLGVGSLLDLSAQCVAKHMPYGEVEHRLGMIPGPVLNRIQLHAFPPYERNIEMYSSNKLHTSHADLMKQPYYLGKKLVENNAVSNVVQIGFFLNGDVRETIGVGTRQKHLTYKCSVSFDRHCITGTECTCNRKTLLWCSHVVAVSLYRIRRATQITIRPPIADSVVTLKKNELQKLLLMLVAERKNEILPVLQTLLDDVRQQDSEFVRLPGLPDPTAGASCGESRTWFFDDVSIAQQIKKEMVAGTVGRDVIAHMNKVREMLSINDTNYIRLLLTITDAIMSESVRNTTIQSCMRARRIYDELHSLWTCVVLNPNLLGSTTKRELAQSVGKYTSKENCPRENGDDKHSGKLLEDIFNETDDIFRLGSTVEALNLCGRNEQALQTCHSILNTLRKDCPNNLFSRISSPVSTVYTCLLDNKLDCEAYELALTALFASNHLPAGSYAQNRVSHRCEKLVSLLEKHDLRKAPFKNLLLKEARKHFKHLSELLKSTERHSDNLPNHCFYRYVFSSLVQIDSELAYELVVLMLPLNPRASKDDDDVTFQYNDVTAQILDHVEHQQGEFAAAVLKQCFADENMRHLKVTLTSILEDVRQPSQLLRLAKLCQATAVEERKTNGDINKLKTDKLLSAAFELGVRSVRLLTSLDERRSCIRWLVSCAVDTGRHAVDFIVRNCRDLFEPKEICDHVSPLLASQSVLFHLKMAPREKEDLLDNIRNMMIEACIEDPVSCILFSLTLCEDHAESFDLLSQVLYESTTRFNAAQLFSIARYFESRKQCEKAFKTGVQALKKLEIGPHAHRHPAICDVLWLSSVASALGMDALTQLVPVLENCVRNPLLLTEIVQRCEGERYCSKDQLFQDSQSQMDQLFQDNQSECATYNLKYSCLEEPLNRLVASAQKLFIEDVEFKLQNITRKNYSDFLLYLQKIKRAFLLAEDGLDQFNWLVDFIVTSQPGKKKLHELISKTFH